MVTRRRTIRLSALLALALLVGVAIYAFAASNTVPATRAAPSVDLAGRLVGVDISDRFTPALKFRLDRLTLVAVP